MKCILIGILLIFSVSASAETDSRREQVEDLLELMDAPSIINSMYSQMDIMLQNMSKELGVKPSETAEGVEVVNAVEAMEAVEAVKIVQAVRAVEAVDATELCRGCRACRSKRL